MFNTKDEDFYYDRKSINIKPKDLDRTIIAFANADGGTIAIGVEDNKTITGIDGHIKQVNDFRYVPINLCHPSITAVLKKLR